MQPDYSDILARIAEAPRWWFNGVPRYEPFSPTSLSVGAGECALALVECQDCRTTFEVGLEPDRWAEGSMFDQIASDDYNAGDPPRHAAPDGSRCAGETMGTVILNVLQAWHWEREMFDFLRQPLREGPVDR